MFNKDELDLIINSIFTHRNNEMFDGNDVKDLEKLDEKCRCLKLIGENVLVIQENSESNYNTKGLQGKVLSVDDDNYMQVRFGEPSESGHYECFYALEHLKILNED